VLDRRCGSSCRPAPAERLSELKALGQARARSAGKAFGRCLPRRALVWESRWRGARQDLGPRGRRRGDFRQKALGQDGRPSRRAAMP
jgi:hypothetical protein